MDILSSEDDILISRRSSKRKSNGNLENKSYGDGDDSDFDMPMTNGNTRCHDDVEEDGSPEAPISRRRIKTKRVTDDSDDDSDDDFQPDTCDNDEGDTLEIKREESDSEDDIPLSRRSRVKSEAESELKIRDNRSSQRRFKLEPTFKIESEKVGSGTRRKEEEDDSEDDVPLTKRRMSKSKKSGSKLKRKRSPVGVKEEDEIEDGRKGGKKKKAKVEKKERKVATPKKKKEMEKKRRKAKTELKEAEERRKKTKVEETNGKFEKRGQKRETPPTTDPSRMFYESMYHEKKKLGMVSDLADTYMVRHGILEDADEINAILRRLDLRP